MKISLILGIMFIVSNQPFFMIGLLMIMVFFLSLFIYFEAGSFWFGYILLLVLLSGVLVIFTYVVSLIPNESFEFFGLMVLGLIFISLFSDSYYYFMKMDDSFVCMFLWEGMMLGYMMYLISFLLGIMIMVVYVSYPQIGALRLYLCAWLKG